MNVFQKMRFKNILSFGNYWTTIDFESKASILVQGNNGAGKSAGILDTLCFGLYGKPFRRIPKTNLVNYKNKKDMVVEIWFIGGNGKQYKVVRGINPTIFEIYENDELINQNSAMRDYQDFFEKQILKIDLQAFSQIVILGKATYVAFLRLHLADRRKFIENVLNLGIFSSMNEINKFKINETKNKLQEIRTQLIILKEKITLTQKHIQDFKHEAIRIQSEHEKHINEQIAGILLEIEKIKILREKKESEMSEIDLDFDQLTSKLESCYEMQSKLNSKLSQTKNRLEFFKVNDKCPTCEGLLDVSIRNSKIDEFNKKERNLERAAQDLSMKTQGIIEKVHYIQKKIEKNSSIEHELRLLDQTVGHKEIEIEKLNSQKFLSHVNNAERIQEEKDKLQVIFDERENKNTERSELVSKLSCLDFISNMLKDTGIKSAIIKQHIPTITKIMNGFMSQLGIFAKFKLDENFEETLYARGIDVLNYQAFSEGEKLRIDLAMLMTWREVCKLQNNMSVNFLIFDEILDASLDELGAESLVSLFKVLSKSGTKVIVISHSSDKWEEKFDKRLEFTKQGGFSKIEEF